MKLPIVLDKCSSICVDCVSSYQVKHKNPDEFTIPCKGIPREYIPARILAGLTEDEATRAIGMYDPVTWAEKTLDWHCIDPDGSVWLDLYQRGRSVYTYDETLAKDGKSPYNRPYLLELLKCTSKRRIARCGRRIGKSTVMCVDMLHYCMTKPHGYGRVLMVAPFKSQIDMLFKTIDQLIEYAPSIQNSIVRKVQSPYPAIEFGNGASIVGFTAGTSSASGANAVRGQGADRIYLDEMDYLSVEDLNSIMAIVHDNKDVRLWLSSTPTGKRQKFFDFCFDPHFKEFFYPSTVLPHWDKAMEMEARSLAGTELGFKREYLAEFGEQQQGIYQVKYVEIAKSDYRYEQIIPEPGWIYGVGVDWNDMANGTVICIVGWNPTQNIYKVCQYDIVGRDGWTQLQAIRRIFEINRTWHPALIYVDHGHGDVQIELMRKMSFDASIDKSPRHPDSQIKDILVPYRQGSKIEIRDLWTKQIVEKHSKPFMIENSVRQFEAGCIKISKYDTELEKELLGYIIDHQTPTGLPVYAQGDGKVGDHKLDSLNLALVGFTLKFSDLGAPKYDTHIAFAGKFGEKSLTTRTQEAIENMGAGLAAVNEKKVEKTSNPPPMNRDLQKNTPILSARLPASNTSIQTKPKLWKWPGFFSDKPVIRKNSGTRRLVRPARPSRKLV